MAWNSSARVNLMHLKLTLKNSQTTQHVFDLCFEWLLSIIIMYILHCTCFVLFAFDYTYNKENNKAELRMRCAASPFLCSNKHSHCLSSCVNNIVCSSLVLSVACRVCVLSWKMLNQLTPPLINKIKKKKTPGNMACMHAWMGWMLTKKKNNKTNRTADNTGRLPRLSMYWRIDVPGWCL